MALPLLAVTALLLAADAGPAPAPGAGPAAAPAAVDAGAPDPLAAGVDADPEERASLLKECASNLDEAMHAKYWPTFSNRTSAASTRKMLSLFAASCAQRFPDWAKAAEQASKVGRAKRSALLAHAVAATCPQAESARVARELLRACPPAGEGRETASEVWATLDAGTYAFVRALSLAGLRSTFLLELMLQASLNPRLEP